MDTAQILNALERERELLKEFHDLSAQQLQLLENENLEGMERLLDGRSDLMLELTAIEATLGTWIAQLRNDPTITTDVLRELRVVNDEIVQLANQILELDEQTHWRLDLIKEKAGTELRGINRGSNALNRYGVALEYGSGRRPTEN